MNFRRQGAVSVIKYLCHGGLVVCLLLLLFGLPVASAGGLPEETDAVSSATVVLPAPSGSFLVFLNPSLHPDTLEQWETFFAGGDPGVLFEDLSCLVIRGDSAGAALAESLSSRLPEHQMMVRAEDGTFLLSKLDAGKADVAVLSREAAEAYGWRERETLGVMRILILEETED